MGKSPVIMWKCKSVKASTSHSTEMPMCILPHLGNLPWAAVNVYELREKTAFVEAADCLFPQYNEHKARFAPRVLFCGAIWYIHIMPIS